MDFGFCTLRSVYKNSENEKEPSMCVSVWFIMIK